MELEPDLATYWSGLVNVVKAKRWWIAAIGIAFLLGLVF